MNRPFSPLRSVLLVLWAVLAAVPVGAGVWSELPDAVNRLQRDRADRSAAAVIAAAEDMVLAEAEAGRLNAVVVFMEVYSGLVIQLADGDLRLEGLSRRLSSALLEAGNARAQKEAGAAAAMWTLAAELDADEAVLSRLAAVVLPPEEPEPGEVWTSPPDGAEMVWHPAMQFRLGCSPTDRNCLRDERFFRWVAVGGLWVQRHEVNNRSYDLCVAAGACTSAAAVRPQGVVLRADDPVVGINWAQARDYCLWAGRRLPTEAEWERAARGTEHEHRFPWGNRRERERVNVLGVDLADAYEGPSPVGAFPPTGLGLCDIAGNVWEWVEDSFHKNALGAPTDASAWVEGGLGRVLRGGSWRREIDAARVSARIWREETYTADDAGFRCLMDPAKHDDPFAVVARGQAFYPLQPEPRTVFSSPLLDTADRRYLLRRSVTWLVLEGRAQEGLELAVDLLQESGRDPVALDLLKRVERRLSADATEGRTDEVRTAVEAYRAALGRTPRLNRRMESTVATVAGELQDAGQLLVSQRDYESARACFNLALRLRPGDAELRRLLAGAEPEAGTRRVFPGDGREMVWIPTGSFMMGAGRGDRQADADEHPARTVNVQGFWLDRSEVTNRAYRVCVEAGACTPPSRTEHFDDPSRAEHPVVWVDWFQARAYAVWAGKRLPSEVERERAARLGSLGRYPWGMLWAEGRCNALGVYGADHWGETSPVGSLPADRWGLVDMVGNVWEWVADADHGGYRGAPRDGRPWTQVTGPQGPPQRVLRGCSFHSPPADCRVSARDARDADNASRDIGFRCAADGP